MKRKMDLFRKILLSLEEKGDFEEPIFPDIPGETKNDISYHIKLLSEQGLIEAKDWSTCDGLEWVAISLTSSGHDFLDAARNENFWEKAKSLIKDNSGVLTLEAMKIALDYLVKNQIFGEK